ncbi:hypothetical protein FZ025_09590 [Xanthomonas hyacinthi]|uniref:hypothetical protein n=1 Tax=Xanthomonas hyacinthi TaxID=56455 RepID=UPI0011B06407|nr:hypothetical protein [Xanthomonas hyacinthi]QGY76889.1 hypothetical protein FZ025_09590 [Xanthomonas hyacinthi]
MSDCLRAAIGKRRLVTHYAVALNSRATASLFVARAASLRERLQSRRAFPVDLVAAEVAPTGRIALQSAAAPAEHGRRCVAGDFGSTPDTLLIALDLNHA